MIEPGPYDSQYPDTRQFIPWRCGGAIATILCEIQ
jgi:hypothetical protein